MSKRRHSQGEATASKRVRDSKVFTPIKIATEQAAADADLNAPLSQLMTLIAGNTVPSKINSSSVVYWMRMSDLRLRDNKALSRASQKAMEDKVPLIALFIISPQDYIAHDRGTRKIDFLLRNLATLKESFSELHIPFHTASITPRKSIASFVSSFCESYGARYLFANYEYELDELRRDIEVYNHASTKGIQVDFEHDQCIIEPGALTTKQGNTYVVYSPYQKNWLATLNANIAYYLEDCPFPKANEESVRFLEPFSRLFETSIPTSIDGFHLNKNDREMMKEVWPEGEKVAADVLGRFLTTKARPSQIGAVNPLSFDPEKSDKTSTSRIVQYNAERDRMDSDTTSRLSAYLSSGVISARECVRATMVLLKKDKVEGERSSGIGRWIQELAWRDFYKNILAAFPRVSMGRPYLEKFSNVVWENHKVSGVGRDGKDEDDVDMLKRWKAGMTGVPIVDASMRCMNAMGWVHNRGRMIAAMFLTKDLMIDWRVGERYFMEQLVDGDLSSNNGGWQWCASTGVDPCPYFRIFNPYNQSLKADPNGDFIRHWIPELRVLNGSDLHNPPTALADKLGYPRPIVSHSEARERALRRYRNPGEE